MNLLLLIQQEVQNPVLTNPCEEMFPLCGGSVYTDAH